MSAEQIQTQLSVLVSLSLWDALLIIPVNRNSNAYFDLVSFSILFYEYWITLDWEISRYWGTRLSWPKALFFVNRYGTLLGNIPVVMEYFWSENSTPTKIKVSVCDSDDSDIPLTTVDVRFSLYSTASVLLKSYVTRCLALESYHQYFIIATQVLVAAMLTLRTHALYERSKRVLALMITVIVGCVVIGIWTVLTGKAVDKSTNLSLYFGCDYPTSRAGLSLAAAWGAVAASRDADHAAPIFSLYYYAMGLYTSALCSCQTSNIVTFVLGTPYTRGIATTFTNIISSVMITRLMFNIRDPALAYMAGQGPQSTVTADIRFAPYRREGETGQPNVELDTDVDATLDIELTNLNLNRRTAPGPDPHQAGGSSSLVLV
ncbi:hypothetical protein K438DRAFT_1971983 [Mycena galopus ATCC 62051]|nr:hypothetical protein K438DRAFT_1971983 [Mycena galopus ATCC 62051]